MDMKKLSLAAIILLLILVIAGSAASAPGPLAQTPAPELKLRVGTFVPAEQEELALPDTLRMAPYPRGISGYYIVQFRGPVQEAWKNGVRKAGGEILEYIPDYAYKVYMTPEQAAQIGRQPAVVWTGIFQPAFKIDPTLIGADLGLIKIRAEVNANEAQIAKALAATGTKIVNRGGKYFVVIADQSQIAAMAQLDGVAWLEPFILYEKHNEYGAGVILGANTAHSNGYDGSTQIAAVADTGLGGGTAATAHADIPPKRITEIQDFRSSGSAGCYNVIPDGAQDVDSGHGTHTAVSIVGDGDSLGKGRGSAPAAKLLFQAVEDYADFIGNCSLHYADDYYLIGIPADFGDLYQPAYDAGARVHSNSWGSKAAGDYTADSAATDQFMWNNPDLLVTFSAGNAGIDANDDGLVDDDSIGSPATAKNVLSVGASENDRDGDYACDTRLTYTSFDAYQQSQTCSSMGGNNILGRAGQRWGFTAPPLKDDLVAGNAEQMAPFSSRGPTDDGRVKPDVVAPGTWVLSGNSDLYQLGYGDPVNPQNGSYQSDAWGMPRNEAYKYMGGTSMSNPIAAGAAVVVRDYYQKAHGHSASAALTKATLINSAVDLLDENNDSVDDNDFPIPNVHEGWGRVDLAAATDGSRLFVDNTTGVSTNGSVNYDYFIDSGKAFRVTLVWTDFPSTEAAALNLVNDLNLIVTGPGGSPTYHGNVFSGGWSQTGGSADTVNNVENVYIQAPAAGAWTVEVSGANVPQGPQPFALVVSAAFGAPPVETPPPANMRFSFFVPVLFNDYPPGISGRITDRAGVGIGGVTVKMDGGNATISDASGLYGFSNLDPGTYVLHPEKEGVSFQPQAREVTLPPGAVRQDFVTGPPDTMPDPYPGPG